MRHCFRSLSFAPTALLLALLLLGSPGARAAVLLDLVDDPTSQIYALNFTATDVATDITFSGYNPPGFTSAFGITLTLQGGGPQLLAILWTYIAAPSGALAGQFDDGLGTGVNSLGFGGLDVGSYDSFVQTVATTVGATYTLSFEVSHSGSPNALRVEASAAAVPEPASLALLGLGLVAIGALRRRAG